MAFSFRQASESQKRQLTHQRMVVIGCVLGLCVLIIASRLIELQVVRGREYREIAQNQHFGGVVLSAKRGEILGLSSKTGESNIFATNTTLNLVYVDPSITDDPTGVANSLADVLLTADFHSVCSQGLPQCPRELISFYAAAFDPLATVKLRQSGGLLEPLPPGGKLPPDVLKLPNLVQARDAFAKDIERRISQKQVTFSPIKYGATKIEMSAVQALDIPGVQVQEDQNLIYADPQEINQSLVDSFAKKVALALSMDPQVVGPLLRARVLRYVPIMRRLPLSLSQRLLEEKATSAKDALDKAEKSKSRAADLHYPYRSVALIPEQWRYYPDTTVASHIVGFVNGNQEPQYGVERTYNAQLRGQEGLISTVSDPHGGQILRPEQTIVNPEDGDTVVLTLDRTIQKEVEDLMAKAIEHYRADSGQAIVMDPFTGRILAMVNAPLFDSNNYASVNEKEPVQLDKEARAKLVVEVFQPGSNVRVVKAYMDQVFTASGRLTLNEKTRSTLSSLEKLYTLRDLTRYYMYISQSVSREVFPTDKPDIWLKFKNNLGIGAYLNRAVQEIYEPGSVMKPITMAIAIDQGEVVPNDTYEDTGVVEVDQYKIDNNDHNHYGHVTMTNCLEFSINTCMTSISFKLGGKLFYESLNRFGFGQPTGIELEDELPGTLKPWRIGTSWSRTELATIAFGQGISATPLQMITAWAALANGGKLVRPTIIDSIVHPNGKVEKTTTHVVDQVLTQKSSQTITAMLVSSAAKGFAKAGKPAGYRIAGKTGTSQIAGPGSNGYETGTGTTFATYAGYAPVDHPKFLVLVKLDRPKTTQHGATAAAPVFKDIASFLFQYYDIPPDDVRK